jgi:hypothetical protein
VTSCVHRTVYVLRGVAHAVSEVTAVLFFGYFREMLDPVVMLFTVYSTVPETCALVLELMVSALYLLPCKTATQRGQCGLGKLRSLAHSYSLNYSLGACV